VLNVITTKRFEKDVKLAKKRGKDLKRLKEIMDILIEGKKLPKKFCDHSLTGNFNERRECHIEPDWLLIYKLGKYEIVFERTGSHSDLFK